MAKNFVDTFCCSCTLYRAATARHLPHRV